MEFNMHFSILTLLFCFFSVVAGQSSSDSRTDNTIFSGPTTVSPTQTTQSTDTTSDSRTANTIVSGPSTLSPTQTTQSTDTTSDSHTANTIASGPTTVTSSQTGMSQGHTANAAAFPTMRPADVAGLGIAVVGLGFGMIA